MVPIPTFDETYKSETLLTLLFFRVSPVSHDCFPFCVCPSPVINSSLPFRYKCVCMSHRSCLSSTAYTQEYICQVDTKDCKSHSSLELFFAYPLLLFPSLVRCVVQYPVRPSSTESIFLSLSSSPPLSSSNYQKREASTKWRARTSGRISQSRNFLHVTVFT